MAGSQPWNSLGYVEKCWIASKATMNAAALDSEGNSVDLKNCGIDTMKIATLGEYLADRRAKEGKEINLDLRDDKELARRYVIPITLPNGQEIEIIVNKNGQDEACMYKDEAGNEKEFQLTPRMKKAIGENIPEGLEKVIGEEVCKSKFLPDSLDDYAEKVQKDELVPKNKKHAAKIAGIETGELKKEEKEIEAAEKEIPAEARDKIARICSEHGLDIKNLKEVMEVHPSALEDKLEKTGIRENKGRLYCLRFRDGSNLQGRVVMVQGENAIDERKYDDYMNDFMNEHKRDKYVTANEAERDGKIAYTDLDGNTTVCEITREPRDLEATQKDILLAEMEKLDRNQKYILNSDMPLEDKTREIIKINDKRLDLFEEYGIKVPTVENEIEADIEISKEVNNKVTSESDGQDDYDDNGGNKKVTDESGGQDDYDDNGGHERLTPAEEAMRKRGF